MLTRILCVLLFTLMASAATQASNWAVVNGTCYGAAPLQQPATPVIAERTYRFLGADSGYVVLRRKVCSDGSTAIYATSTSFDQYHGPIGATAVFQNGVAYTPKFSQDPLGCNYLPSCGFSLGFYNILGVTGFPYTTVMASVDTILQTEPAFDDEQAFTLSLTGGGGPIVTTTYAIPASGGAMNSLPPSRRLSDNMTGTWWNPNRGGEGFTFDIGTLGGKRYLFFTWYTYVDQRGVFLSGSAELSTTIATSSVQMPIYQTRGARFGSQFLSSQVITDPVGSVRIERLACGQVQLSYTGSLGVFATQTIFPLWAHDFDASCQ